MTNSAASTPAIELRPAAADDLPSVVSLLNHAYRSIGGEAGWTTEKGLIDGDRDSEPMLRQEMADKPDARLMVWAPKGKVAGCVWLEPAGDDQWYLGSFAIEPQMQNKRFGRQLLAASEHFICEHGGRIIKMTVIETRSTLIAWYERRGYCRTGTTVPFPYTETRFGVPRTADLRFVVLSKEMPYP